MTILLHVTQACILAMFVALSKNLMNAYVVLRLYGSIPTRVRRRYERELIAFCALSVITAVMVIVSIVAVEVVW